MYSSAKCIKRGFRFIRYSFDSYGNFLFAWAALFQFKINCLNCKSSFHNNNDNNNNNNNRKKKKKEERIIIERIVKVVSFIYTKLAPTDD